MKNQSPYSSWWYCDNIICHPGMVALLHMDFPQVFILMRDYSAAYWADYEHWKSDLVEVNFFNPSERKGADLDALLTDAWNFLAAEEAEEERQAELRELEEEEGLDELGIPYLD